MKKLIAVLLSVALSVSLASCGGTASNSNADYTIGLCNYVDDASLNQIVGSIESRLAEISKETGITFDVAYDNCQADPNILSQIVSNFMVDGVDLMCGVATPVAVTMQAVTEGTGIPVVFAAVSDPVASGLVESLEAPGSNLTGTSDYLDTDAVLDLIFAENPDADFIGLLYDVGQDSSTTPIAKAKAYLEARGIAYKEYNGTTVDEVVLAADAAIADGVDAIFTPTDNTIMTAELSIYEALAASGIPHYCGADSFALNGAFLGYGVNYENLGVETANMIADILINQLDVATVPVKTFDNGTATVNTDTCKALSKDYETVLAIFEPLCSKVQAIETAESF